MADLADNNLFVFFSLFYSIFFGLMTLLPFDVIYSDGEVPDVGLESLDGMEYLTGTVSYFFRSMTGLPVILNIILFVPFGAIATYWLIRFILWALPFTGGS